MPHPRRILIIRPSALGDVCRSVPVLVSLRRAFPSAAIDWLIQDTFAEAVEHHPDLNDVILFPRRRLARWHHPSAWRPIRDFLRMLRARQYDLVLECQGLARSGIFAAATGAPRRVGFANAAELGWLGLTEGVHAATELHAVDRMLLVVRAAGVQPVRDLRLYTSASNRAIVDGMLGPTGPGSGLVVLAPTTRWPAKLWPDARFAELARRLLAEGLADRIALVGASSEREQCDAMVKLAQSEDRVIDLVGKTSVGQLMAIVERASLVIGSDSAALHMAVGFNRRMLGLFGPTRVSRVGPYQREQDVIQHVTSDDRIDHKDAPSGQALMARITVDEVLAAARERLADRAPASPPPQVTVTAPSSPATPSTSRS